MVYGIIFSIEEFAINDGPGIRTTVFLKGCPLRCAWCHNPEGLDPRSQVMHYADGDRTCGERWSSEELAARLLKDRDFYEMNDGGVTFTGGEPTMQPEFLIDVLDRLDGIHTAVETSGWCAPAVFRRVLERVDYVLFDIKHTDPGMHRRYTGAGNEPVLANLKYLVASGKPFVARIPLIPGVNDSPGNMEATLSLVKDAPNLVRVELLRYHRTAGAKYSKVDMIYNPQFDTEAEPEVHDVFTPAGIDCIVL